MKHYKVSKFSPPEILANTEAGEPDPEDEPLVELELETVEAQPRTVPVLPATLPETSTPAVLDPTAPAFVPEIEATAAPSIEQQDGEADALQMIDAPAASEDSSILHPPVQPAISQRKSTRKRGIIQRFQAGFS